MNDKRCLQLSRDKEKKKKEIRGTGGNDGGSPLVLRVIGGFGMYHGSQRRFGIRDCKRSM